MSSLKNIGISGLPQELHDCIIDHLRDDRATLRVCALTTQRWPRRSYMYLYEQVKILGTEIDNKGRFTDHEIAQHVRKVTFVRLKAFRLTIQTICGF